MAERARGPSPLVAVATGVAAAVALGLAFVTATVLAVRILTRAPDPGAGPDLGLPFYILVGGTLGGVLLAALVAWRLLGPVASTYRRGGFAVASGFATVLLMLVCMPVDQLLGAAGLAGLLGLSAALGLVLAWQARRTA